MLFRSDGVLIPAAITFLMGLVVLGAVARGRRRLALGLFGLHVAVGGVLLGIALHLSQASDGKLIFFTAAVELVGLAMVTLHPGDQAESRTPSPKM